MYSNSSSGIINQVLFLIFETPLPYGLVSSYVCSEWFGTQIFY